MGCIRIERVAQGFEVCVDDPKIVEANRTEKGGWKDPTGEYMFKTWEQVTEFLTKIVDDALPVDEYSSAFSKAAEEVLK